MFRKLAKTTVKRQCECFSGTKKILHVEICNLRTSTSLCESSASFDFLFTRFSVFACPLQAVDAH